MNKKLNHSLWELYNEYSIKGVMIISRADFKREAERISIQNNVSQEKAG
jgi:hypothetical protein